MSGGLLLILLSLHILGLASVLDIIHVVFVAVGIVLLVVDLKI